MSHTHALQIENIPLRSLTSEQWQAWSEIQLAHPELDSPHFTPRYLQCLLEHREGLEVAILKTRGQIVGFFPFHRSSRNAGEPVAGSFSELQGLIAAPDLQFDARALLRSCGLSRIAFTDLLASQGGLQQFHAVTGVCPFLDLSQGFEAYRQNRRAAGSDELQQTLRKARKIQREIAPLRFISSSPDVTALATLLDWKQRQLQERKLVNPFAVAWPQQLMARLLNVQEAGFAGMLSLLYVGDKLAAGSMGIRAGGVLNCWVTAYDLKYQRFSPGLILLAELAQAAPGLGIHRIDLGRGDENYKKSFASGGIPVAEGTIERSRIAHALRNATFQAREWVRTTPLGQPARQVVQRCRYALAQWKPARE